ncbi:hypothetical protein D3C71_2066850 [compost metagenome]
MLLELGAYFATERISRTVRSGTGRSRNARLLRRPRISVSVNRVAAVLISVPVSVFIAVSISASNSISIALFSMWGSR